MVRYCGYACTPDAPLRPKHIRNRRLSGRPGNKLIVAMAGGGADGYPMMSSLLDALGLINAECPSSVVLVTGPFMPDAQRQDLRARAEGLPVKVRTTVREPLGYMAAADLVVAMAGYNTTIELLRVGTPALLVPRRGPSSEQRMRARRFAARGWVSQLDPDDLSAQRLADEVVAILVSGAPKSTAARPDLGGIERAVEYLRAAALIAHLKRQTDPSPDVVPEEEMSPA
jgi:predicted glycosyltransferase